MAVAVKNAPETRTTSAPDSVQYVSLIGALYFIASLAVIFKAIPEVLRILGVSFDSFVGVTLLVLAILAGAAALIYVGAKLLGPKQVPGMRAGIFVSLLFLLLVLLLTRWVSLWVEYWVYFNYLFHDNGRIVGIVLTSVAGAGFLFLFGRWFCRSSFAQTLVGIEGQGWFTAHAYKPQQGQKVRRGTISGLLLIVGAGIYTMISHQTLARGSGSWEIGIPFTGRMVDIQPDDGANKIEQAYKDHPDWKTAGIPAYQFRDIRDDFDPAKFVRIDTLHDLGPYKDEDGKEYTFKKDDNVPRSLVARLKKNLPEDRREELLDTEDVEKLKEESKQPGSTVTVKRAVVVPADPPRARMQLATITLLPHIRFTVPLLLLGVALWLAWRIVNLPVFADFLIATEAELNKVSWTTRPRLFQDTIVVLTTMVLLAVLLFGMDQVWLHLLSWKRIGVIQQNEDQSQQMKGDKPLW